MDPTDDSPLGQMLRFLIDKSARMSSDKAWGQVVITYREGQIDTVTESQSHKYPTIPCRPPSGRRV